MPDFVVIENPEIQQWFNYQNAKDTALENATALQTGIQVLQLIAYYNLFDDAIDSRDDKIDAQIAWMQELEDYKETQDLPMLRCKKDVLTGLGLPSVDMCSDALRCTSDAMNDGDAVDQKATQLSLESCGGLPSGWGLHEGSLMAAKAGSYAGGVIANNAKRQQEEFRSQKTDLVRAGQTGMKAVYNANDTLAKYAQAASIHSGLADIFLQGFNSAGAALGVSLGRLASSSGTTNAVTPGPSGGLPGQFGGY